MKILITGIAGVGKTTTLAELQKRGYVVIDLDATGICQWKNKVSKDVVEYGPHGRDTQWLQDHGWYADIETMKRLLSCIRSDKEVFVTALTENIEEVVSEFDKIFILTLDDTFIKERLSNRTNNHFAQNPEEQDLVLSLNKELLDKIKSFTRISTDQAPERVADEITGSL